MKLQFRLGETRRYMFGERQMRRIALIYSPKKARSGVTKIMMWGYITSKGRGILLPVNGSITSEKYYQVLQDGLLPVINWYYADANLFLTKITLLATTHLNQEAGLMIAK